VQEFIDQILGPAGLARAVVVATPADNPPLMRMHGAAMATSIAEYFRDTGRHVLLLMDSLTRYAQAQREIALTIGEPPATRGFPPSVFARLPQLVERAGTGIGGRGSITAFYTVLTEADDPNDPIADAARAILDGHIVLSRRLAERGVYPAIDIEASISRVMTQITSEAHLGQAKALRQAYSVYEQNVDLFNVGAYQQGGNAELDRAVELRPQILRFLNQSMREAVDFDTASRDLAAVVGAMGGTRP
jgi:flagellum-specific ATP synthase